VVESASLAVSDVMLRGVAAAMNLHNQGGQPKAAKSHESDHAREPKKT
jgi:hypothetical protein